MLNKNHRISFPCVAALCALLLWLSPCALALGPENEPEKGTIPAASTELNVSSYAEASDYEVEPADVETLFIGLAYGESSVNEASFGNTSGRGFRLGHFDAERHFHADAEYDSSALTVRAENSWYLLLDEVFPSQESVEQFTQQYLGISIFLDGEYRVIVGPLAGPDEVNFVSRWYALSGSAWQEECLALYDESWRLLDLFIDAEELAVEAISEGKALTSFQGEQYYGSFLLQRRDAESLTVINAVGLEDYVKGVIPYEMSPAWPVEALKAQAVCARTYAAYNLGAYEEEYGFDLTNDTESQVYRGANGADAVTDAAVEATSGQFVRYEGQLCEVYYFSSDGGATEDGAKVFGSEQPYLAGKTDPFESALKFAVVKWERWRSGDDMARWLRQKGYEIGSVTKLEPLYSELGNVVGMSYYDESGACVRLDHRESYSLLSLDNCRFHAVKDGDGYRFSGRGWGHNCGMSQWGAHAMASVYGYTADDIIRFYFTGAYIG